MGNKQNNSINNNYKLLENNNNNNNNKNSNESEILNFFDYKIFINQTLNNQEKSNKISTSKYTFYNAIPKILIEQFSKIANIYFLIIAIFQMFKEISNADGKPVILLPLSIVVLINGIKNYYEDWKRKKSDEEENMKNILIYNKNTKTFENKKWCDIKIGDILKIEENNFFPCDCIIISVSEKNGLCFIETKNIDGETNFKHKKANSEINNKFISKNNNNNQIDFEMFYDSFITCQSPNEFIYEFNGKFYFTNQNNKTNKENYIFLEYDNFLLRGCSLKQTKFLYAFVIYVGHDTKIMKNSPHIKNKISRIENIMNKQMILVFIFELILSLIVSISHLFLIKKDKTINYLFYPYEKDPNNNKNLFLTFFINFGTWIILINNIVPISLLVTLEMVKYIQGMFISWDIYMYDKVNKTMPKIQSSTLNEELGQVKFIFSDKTGTLTKNYMEFTAMSIGNKIYGLEEIYKDDNINQRNLIEDEFGKIYNFNLKSSNFENDLNDNNSKNYNDIHLFLLCLALCHSVMIDEKKLPIIEYKSSSPDESAMVNCARYFKYIFNGRDINNNIYLITKNNIKIKYKILNILEYSSERKRMSVIVKTIENKIFLFSKGADNVISERISLNKEQINITNEHLLKFAKKGLRTLMIAYRTITEEEYNLFNNKYISALNDLINKEKKLKEAFDLIENNLYLLGATAIEDKLQNNVSEVLESFINAGIKIWLLTGDKMDTAKSISYSCNLINHSFHIFDFEENNTNEEYLEKKLTEYYSFINKSELSSSSIHIKYALIISLNELTKILHIPKLKNLFYILSIKCNSVLCCRVTPNLKAEMVNLIKTNQPTSTTLAIGDGANDVNMITTADLGIGIIGVEGRQAARASDYAIGEFQYLKRLLFVHGRESYRKNSFIVCYNFYKNFLFVMPHFWFGIISYFSGQSLYDPWIYQLFNIIYTSFPIIWFGIYDKEVSYDILISDYRYYTQGIIGKLFHSLRFWKWIVYGILQALVIFIYSFLGCYLIEKSGMNQSLESVGSSVYCSVVLIANIKILLTTCTHSFISFGLFIFSILSYFLILIISSLSLNFYDFNNSYMLFKDPNFYLCSLINIIICICMDLGFGKIFRLFGIIVDPLEINVNDYDEKILKNDKIIELIRETYKENNNKKNNNLYKGSAFTESENKEKLIKNNEVI